MLMVITHMVAKVMFNKINKILLFIFVFSCAIFPYGNVFAVNYNSGLYNAGLYSDTAPSTPTSSPVAGLYNSTQSVTLSATGSTSIRYSTTSTPADCSSGTLYTTPISVSSSQTIYAKACDDALNSSTISFAYTISIPSSRNNGAGLLFVSTPPPPAIPNTVLNTTTLTPTNTFDIKKVTKDLKLGMTNKDVKTLQLFLIDQDKGPIAKKLKKNGTTNYFGNLTKSALAEWQKASHVTPASGYFGGVTRGKIKNL